MATINEQLLDQRIVERNIARGLLTRKEYDAWVAGLADKQSKGEVVRVAEPVDGAADGSGESR